MSSDYPRFGLMDHEILEIVIAYLNHNRDVSRLQTVDGKVLHEPTCYNLGTSGSIAYVCSCMM